MNRFALAIACAGLLGAALVPSAHADEWNKRTVITVDEPIQVPNQVLSPGTYVLKLLDSPSNRHIVQIFDKDGQHLITTVLAIPNYRMEPTGKTQFSFWETPPGQPRALRAWFYPGDNYGQEFAYPKSEAVSIAANSHAPVPTTYAENTDQLTTARVENTAPAAPEPESQTTAQAQEPAPAPAPEPEPQVAQNTPPPAPEPQATAPAQEPEPAPTPQNLPQTASPLPMVGLFGLLSLSAFLVVRVYRMS